MKAAPASRRPTSQRPEFCVSPPTACVSAFGVVVGIAACGMVQEGTAEQEQQALSGSDGSAAIP